jgi:hypothetical protein
MMVWRENAACVIVRRDTEPTRARVLGMLLCDYTAAASVHAFCGNDTHDTTFTVPPLRVDTATDSGDGVVHVTTREVSMLRGVELGMLGLGSGSSDESEQRGHDDDTSQQRIQQGEAKDAFYGEAESPWKTLTKNVTGSKIEVPMTND